MLQFLFQAVLDALFPPRCPLCRRQVGRHGDFCPACGAKLIHARKVPLDRRCIKSLEAAYALTDYRGGMKALLQAVKYRKDFKRLAHIDQILRLYITREMVEGIDLAVPVPLHQEKLRARGFNQTEKIFAGWIKESGIVYCDALTRIKDTPPQYGLNRSERRQNVAGAFALKGGAELSGKSILLLDDILTTGFTMDACAKILRRAGAKRVAGLAIASDAGQK